ncbi:toll/interleukin-1 receptor domain-containing protein, partial [Flavobacterium psychrophilum]
MHNKIFISYAKEDIIFAEKLYSYLELNDFRPWLDKKDLLPGQNWNFTIKKSLREADYIIALLSSNSVQKRGYVQREFKLALDYYEEKLEDDIYLIPLKINNCEIPLALSKFQWTDFNENDSFQKILQSLNLQREKLIDYE